MSILYGYTSESVLTKLQKFFLAQHNLSYFLGRKVFTFLFRTHFKIREMKNIVVATKTTEGPEDMFSSKDMNIPIKMDIIPKRTDNKVMMLNLFDNILAETPGAIMMELVKTTPTNLTAATVTKAAIAMKM